LDIEPAKTAPVTRPDPENQERGGGFPPIKMTISTSIIMSLLNGLCADPLQLFSRLSLSSGQDLLLAAARKVKRVERPIYIKFLPVIARVIPVEVRRERLSWGWWVYIALLLLGLAAPLAIMFRYAAWIDAGALAGGVK
jgi:hypothetical protein